MPNVVPPPPHRLSCVALFSVFFFLRLFFNLTHGLYPVAGRGSWYLHSIPLLSFHTSLFDTLFPPCFSPLLFPLRPKDDQGRGPVVDPRDCKFVAGKGLTPSNFQTQYQVPTLFLDEPSSYVGLAALRRSNSQVQPFSQTRKRIPSQGTVLVSFLVSF